MNIANKDKCKEQPALRKQGKVTKLANSNEK